MDSEQKQADADSRPVWSRPEIAVLDVEQGTVAMTGPYADGTEASTS